MKKYFLIIIVITNSLFAFDNSNQPSISTILNPDGTVKTGTNGSYNVEGYYMGYTQSGAPQFVSTVSTPPTTYRDTELYHMLAEMNNRVGSLAVNGSDLYAGGSFTIAGGVPANMIAKWNGTTWSALGSGMNNGVFSLAVIGTDLYAGGNFTIAGAVYAFKIAKWNGTT